MVLKRNKSLKRTARPLSQVPATYGLRPRYWGKLDVANVQNQAVADGACEGQWAVAMNCFKRSGFREKPCMDVLQAYQDCVARFELASAQRRKTAAQVKRLGLQGGIKEKWVEQ